MNVIDVECLVVMVPDSNVHKLKIVYSHQEYVAILLF